MLSGIIIYRNKLPKFLLNIINFVPVALTATYLALVTAIIVPLAVAVCAVLVPLLYVLWRAKKNTYNPTFSRILYPFELIGLTIVNAPQIATKVAARTQKIKLKRPSMPAVQRTMESASRTKGGIIAIKILALLAIAGIAVYLVAVAVVMLPLAAGAIVVLVPTCYLAWYIKERKFIPLFYKIPVYFEQLGSNIVNSRKKLTNLMVNLKSLNVKWPML